MTPLLIVIGVFAWGCIVGALLTLLVALRYVRDLHERVKTLEQPAESGLVSIRFDPLYQSELAVLLDMMEADEEFEDAPPVTRH